MVISLLLAAALVVGGPPDPNPQVLPRSQAVQDSPVTQLEEVVVDGQRERAAAEAFVRSVAEPIRGRKAAVWQNSVCVGVAGMQGEAAQFMIDRVSDWAHSVGLTIEAPGCKADIIIVAADDGDAMAREMVASMRREFRPGIGDSARGPAALEEFQTSGAPVRWWHVSLVVNEDTNQPVRRLPGQGPITGPAVIRSPMDLGSWGSNVQPSLLNDETRDDLRRTVVIIDTEALDVATFAQVTDYVAMVALAQVDPETMPESPSILRLFNPAEAQEDALTRWDRAYLTALYGSRQGRRGTGANLAIIASALVGELGDEADPAEPATPVP